MYWGFQQYKVYVEDKSGGLNNFMEEMGGIDLGYSGNEFTWCNRREGWRNINDRLDRAVSNNRWRLVLPRARIRHLPTNPFGHSPLLLCLNVEVRSRPCLFRFEAS